jgi:hypothetical protein
MGAVASKKKMTTPKVVIVSTSAQKLGPLDTGLWCVVLASLKEYWDDYAHSVRVHTTCVKTHARTHAHTHTHTHIHTHKYTPISTGRKNWPGPTLNLFLRVTKWLWQAPVEVRPVCKFATNSDYLGLVKNTHMQLTQWNIVCNCTTKLITEMMQPGPANCNY